MGWLFTSCFIGYSTNNLMITKEDIYHIIISLGKEQPIGINNSGIYLAKLPACKIIGTAGADALMVADGS